MSETIEYAKAATVQTEAQKAQLEPFVSTDAVLQNLMVADTNLERILKGEVHEAIDNLQHLITSATAMEKIDNALAFNILAVCRDIKKELGNYMRIVPYLMLMSHLMRLTNIDKEEVQAIKREVKIMICRTLLTMKEEDLKMHTMNMFTAIKIIIFNGINDSFNGWKAKITTEQKRVVRQEFVEEPRKKKRLGFI